ncbi:MAG: LemA family protein [Vampirovibrionales bacterium]|nr:LemA family protein [Vampirovibrionales bacterium]
MKKIKSAMAFKKPLLLLTLIASVSLMSGCGYNEIQGMDEEINNKWAQVESQLQRRADLVPNLVKVVKSYATHEKEVFTNIADARAKLGGAIQSKDPSQIASAEGQFNSALSRLLVVAENYPQLKADQQYVRLMDELSGTENRIAVSRMDYNNAVRDYNRYIRQFPNNMTALVIKAETRKYYDPPASSQAAPEVDMN